MTRSVGHEAIVHAAVLVSLIYLVASLPLAQRAETEVDQSGVRPNEVPGQKPAAGEFVEPIRKLDLAAVGHRLELPTCFPCFLFVPWHLRAAMIVWVADEGCFLARA